MDNLTEYFRRNLEVEAIKVHSVYGGKRQAIKYYQKTCFPHEMWRNGFAFKPKLTVMEFIRQIHFLKHQIKLSYLWKIFAV